MCIIKATAIGCGRGAGQEKGGIMSLPVSLTGRLQLPVVGAPLFIVSGPELVIAQCKAGVVGSFPALNARPVEKLGEWLTRIENELGEYAA
jgi:nitronate monooxygenase